MTTSVQCFISSAKYTLPVAVPKKNGGHGALASSLHHHHHITKLAAGTTRAGKERPDSHVRCGDGDGRCSEHAVGDCARFRVLTNRLDARAVINRPNRNQSSRITRNESIARRTPNDERYRSFMHAALIFRRSLLFSPNSDRTIRPAVR